MNEQEEVAEADEAEVARPRRGRPPKSSYATATDGADVCPVCGSDQVAEHGDENEFKLGALHCNACGACTIDGVQR